MKLFYTPIELIRLQDPSDLNRRLSSFIQQDRANFPISERSSNVGGYHSRRDVIANPVFADVIELCLSSANKLTRDLDPSSELVYRRETVELQGWYNINEKANFNSPHSHPGFHWSFVYYVTAVPSSGILELIDPRGLVKGSCAPLNTIESNSYRINPQPGLLVCFPSYLTHLAWPNSSDESERISIAINIRLIRNR